MGRLHHIRDTYINNIETALSVNENCRFVLLNYNSPDRLDDWVNEHLTHYIDQNILQYIRTSRPTTFSQSKTKNITSLHATTDIVCNLDADNYLTTAYVDKVLSIFNSDSAPTHQIVNFGNFGDIGGRVACMKKDLIEIGGYDESFDGYGFDDYDFLFRFEKHFKIKRTSLCDLYEKDEFESITGEVIRHEKCLFEKHRHKENQQRSQDNIRNHRFVVNQGKTWGVLE